MREVRRIEITTRHLVRDIVAGEYSSAFRGRGVEFSEVREYQPGDDVRSIDWNVTARLGSPHGACAGPPPASSTTCSRSSLRALRLISRQGLSSLTPFCADTRWSSSRP